MVKRPKKMKQEKGSVDESPAETFRADYPWWAKLLVGFAFMGWIACVALFCSSVQACVDLTRQAFDPAYIKASMSRIANFAALPAEFKPQVAASVFDVRMLTMLYKPDNTSVMFWVLPPEKRRLTARQLADSMADRGIPTVSEEFSVDSKGALPVGGEKVEYVTGLASDKQGNQYGGFIGCAVLKDSKALLIYGWTPQGESGADSNSGSTSSSRKTSATTTADSKSGVAADASEKGKPGTSTDPTADSKSGVAADTNEKGKPGTATGTSSTDDKKTAFDMDAVRKLFSCIQNF